MKKIRKIHQRKKLSRLISSLLHEKMKLLTYTKESLNEPLITKTLDKTTAIFDRFALVKPNQKPSDIYTKGELNTIRKGYGTDTELDRVCTIGQIKDFLSPFNISLIGRASIRLPNSEAIYLDPAIDVPYQNYQEINPTNSEVPSFRFAVFNPYTDNAIRFPYSFGPLGHEAKQMKELLSLYASQNPSEKDYAEKIDIVKLFQELQEPISIMAQTYFEKYGGQLTNSRSGERDSDLFNH